MSSWGFWTGVGAITLVFGGVVLAGVSMLKEGANAIGIASNHKPAFKSASCGKMPDGRLIAQKDNGPVGLASQLRVTKDGYSCVGAGLKGPIPYDGTLYAKGLTANKLDLNFNISF